MFVVVFLLIPHFIFVVTMASLANSRASLCKHKILGLEFSKV